MTGSIKSLDLPAALVYQGGGVSHIYIQMLVARLVV